MSGHTSRRLLRQVMRQLLLRSSELSCGSATRRQNACFLRTIVKVNQFVLTFPDERMIIISCLVNFNIHSSSSTGGIVCEWLLPWSSRSMTRQWLQLSSMVNEALWLTLLVHVLSLCRMSASLFSTNRRDLLSSFLTKVLWFCDFLTNFFSLIFRTLYRSQSLDLYGDHLSFINSFVTRVAKCLLR